MGKSSWGEKGHSSGSGVALNSASIASAPRVQTVGVRDPHRAGRYKVSLVGYSTFPGGLELSARCTGSSRGLGLVASVRLVGSLGSRRSLLSRIGPFGLMYSSLRSAKAGTLGAVSCFWRAQLQRLEGTKYPSWSTVHLQRCFLAHHWQFIARWVAHSSLQSDQEACCRAVRSLWDRGPGLQDGVGNVG